MLHDRQKWTLGLDVAQDLLNTLPGPYPIGFLLFDEQERERIPLQLDRAALARRLEGLRTLELPTKGSRRTAVYDAIHSALLMLNPPQFGDVVYAITDGEDNRSRQREGQLERGLLDRQARLFVFMPQNPADQLERYVGLQRIAKASSGTFVSIGGHAVSAFDLMERPHLAKFSATAKELERARDYARQMQTAIMETYRLELAVPRTSKPVRVKIALKDSAGRDRKDVGLMYPRKFIGCSPATD